MFRFKSSFGAALALLGIGGIKRNQMPEFVLPQDPNRGFRPPPKPMDRRQPDPRDRYSGPSRRTKGNIKTDRIITRRPPWHCPRQPYHKSTGPIPQITAKHVRPHKRVDGKLNPRWEPFTK